MFLHENALQMWRKCAPFVTFAFANMHAFLRWKISKIEDFEGLGSEIPGRSHLRIDEVWIAAAQKINPNGHT